MSAGIVDIRLERLRRGRLVNTVALEAEFNARRGSLAESVCEFAHRAPRLVGAPRAAPNGGYDLDINDFFAWTHVGRILPLRIGRMLRARAIVMQARTGGRA